MDENNKPELRKEFQQKKQELSQLRSQLYNFGSSKEQLFQKLKVLRDKMRAHRSKIRALKEERDSLTKEVKGLKQERNKLNEAVKEKASLQKEVVGKKSELEGHFSVSPGRLRREIERLEQLIVTEVMPFSKEKEISKRIKQLKVQLKEAEKLGEVYKEMNTVSADVAENRRKAQESHEGVQEKAHLSQEKHEQMNQLFDELRKLQAEEKPLQEQFLQQKKQHTETKQKLAAVTVRVNELAKILHEEAEKSFRSRVQERTAEVQEKIKKRKKLTTEDILAFQALKEN